MKTEKEIMNELSIAANKANENKRQLILDCFNQVTSDLLNHKTDLLIDLLWNTEVRDLKRIFKK